MIAENGRLYWLACTIIGNPPAGFNVTRNIGHTLWPGASCMLKCLMMVANTIVASCNAKVDPMHVRGPAPNSR